MGLAGAYTGWDLLRESVRLSLDAVARHIDLEAVTRTLEALPGVGESAVIGVPHPKWSERPLACVVVKPGEDLTADEVLEFLDGRIAKWWMPDDVVFIDEVPKTSVGKFSKKDLRDQFADYTLPTV